MPRSKTASPETPDFLSRLSVVKEPEKAGRGKTQEVVEVPDLEPYGAFHRVKKEFEDGFCETYGAPIKDFMFQRFIAEGVALGRCPENFKGTDGLCGPESSLQLRRKDSRTALKPEQRERLDDLGLEYERDETTFRPHTIIVNPAIYAADKKLVNAMLACLIKGGFDVDAIFQTQQPNERWIVGDNTLNTLFAKAKEAREALAKNPKVNLPCRFEDAEIRELLELVASTSIAPKWIGTFDEAFEMVRKIVAPTAEEQKAALAEAAKSKRQKKAA